MDLEYIKILSTVILAVIGWGVGNWLNHLRARNDKRRELVVQHLIEAYRILTQDIGRRDTSIESITKLENLLSEIQLFGSAKQVDLARKLSNETASEGVSEIDPLIENMRDSLRKELGLEAVEGKTIWLRFTETFKKSVAGSST